MGILVGCVRSPFHHVSGAMDRNLFPVMRFNACLDLPRCGRPGAAWCVKWPPPGAQSKHLQAGRQRARMWTGRARESASQLPALGRSFTPIGTHNSARGEDCGRHLCLHGAKFPCHQHGNERDRDACARYVAMCRLAFDQRHDVSHKRALLRASQWTVKC